MKTTKIFLGFLIVFSSIIPGKNYKGAEYRSIEEFVYGRFEVSYKPANRQGVVSSFFTYHDYSSETGWNEIDIETIGRYNNMFQFNVISPGQKFHIRTNYVEFDPYRDFHDYAFEWTPEYIAFFVDGNEVHRQTGAHINEIIHPSKIMMNIWNPIYSNWVGEWNDAFLPAFSQYDWVAYYSYDPGNGDYGTNNNFSFQWKDDFDAYNPERWEMAEHTFNGNQADFLPENVVFNNGIMTLCLTDNENTGLTDVAPPDVMWARENYNNTVTIQFSEEIDPVTAGAASNYLISGVSITSATVHPNNKLVTLNTEDYDFAKGYNVIIRDIADDSEPANVLPIKAVSINKIDPIEFPFKVNVGGGEFNDYNEDQEWSNKVEYGYMQGDVKAWNNIEINNTDNDEVFRIQRKGIITYKIRVPNGTYDLRLLFADNNNSLVEEKVFDIVVEGDLVRNDLNVADLAGMNTAYEVQSEVEVLDEIIDIYLPEEVDSNFVSAIELYQVTTDTDYNEFQNPQGFHLLPNFPNPFNGYTTFTYSLENRGDVDLEIYNLLGQRVFNRKFTHGEPGMYSFTWNAKDSNHNLINSGIYYLQLINNSQTKTQKIVYLK